MSSDAEGRTERHHNMLVIRMPESMREWLEKKAGELNARDSRKHMGLPRVWTASAVARECIAREMRDEEESE